MAAGVECVGDDAIAAWANDAGDGLSGAFRGLMAANIDGKYPNVSRLQYLPMGSGRELCWQGWNW